MLKVLKSLAVRLVALFVFCVIVASISVFGQMVANQIKNQPAGQYPESELDPLEKWESTVPQFPAHLVDVPITPEVKEIMRRMKWV